MSKELHEPKRHTGRFWWLMYVLLIVLALIYISPFLIQVLNSFKTDAEATSYRVSSIRAISTR